LHHPGAVLLSVADHPTLAQASAFAAIRNPSLVRVDFCAPRLSSMPPLHTQPPHRVVGQFPSRRPFAQIKKEREGATA